MSIVLPHTLHGHAATIFADLERRRTGGTLPHGILLSGPRGTGKATLAFAIAEALLGKSSTARIAAGSHTDLLVIAPLYDEKKEAFKEEISAEQTRHIPEFLSLTPGEGAWRVVIIDGAELMNNAAANAILKILEEPPQQTVLILVSHQAGRLLPTIRSRCQLIRISPPSLEDYITIIREHAPDIGRESAEELGRISDYSPGLAMELYQQNALDMLGQMSLIFGAFPELSHERVLAMAETIASGNIHRNMALFTRLVLFIISQKATADVSLDWAERWQKTQHLLATSTTRHLDYKSTVISIFAEIFAVKPNNKVGSLRFSL